MFRLFPICLCWHPIHVPHQRVIYKLESLFARARGSSGRARSRSHECVRRRRRLLPVQQPKPVTAAAGAAERDDLPCETRIHASPPRSHACMQTRKLFGCAAVRFCALIEKVGILGGLELRVLGFGSPWGEGVRGGGSKVLRVRAATVVIVQCCGAASIELAAHHRIDNEND